MLERLLIWTQNVFAPLGTGGLFLLAVIESIFFPIPVDVLLIVLAVARPELWLFYAFIATLGSVIGAAIGYRVGRWGGEVVLLKLVSKKNIDRVHDLFEKYKSPAIFIAGFTPIPYKVFAVGAGVFYVSFIPFIIMSIISRGLRFILVAFVAAWIAANAVSGPLMNAIMLFGVLLAAEVWVASRLWKSSNTNISRKTFK